jgi:hypothetical protein
MVEMKSAIRLMGAHLQGQPGLSRAARDALLVLQPATVLDALQVRGVGRKTTGRLLAAGLLIDPEGIQHRARKAEELGI